MLLKRAHLVRITVPAGIEMPFTFLSMSTRELEITDPLLPNTLYDASITGSVYDAGDDDGTRS